MSARDTYTAYLHHLSAREIAFRVVDDGRPAEDDLAAIIAGLRKLAEAAGEMAEALNKTLGGAQ